jgi:hypothetical protein
MKMWRGVMLTYIVLPDSFEAGKRERLGTFRLERAGRWFALQFVAGCDLAPHMP